MRDVGRVGGLAAVALTMAACWTGRAPVPPLVLAPAATPAVPAPAPVARREMPRAAAILDAMAKTYAQAGSYTDRGEVVTTGRYPRRMPFATVFVRPAAFRFEFEVLRSSEPPRDGAGPRPDLSSLIWTIGSLVYMASPHENAELAKGDALTNADLETDLGFALLHAGRSSSMVSYRVPWMLLFGGPGDKLDDPSIAGEDTIDGRSCWQITGLDWNREPVTLSIDEATFVLRRVYGPDDKSGAMDVTTYHPVLNAPVDAVQLAGPDIAVGPPALLAPPTVQVAADRWIGVTADADMVLTVVAADSPAARAKLQLGDQIVSLDGVPVARFAELSERVKHTPIGATLRVGIFRAGKVIEVAVVVGARPAQPVARALPPMVPTSKPAPDFAVDVLSGSPDPHLHLADLKGHVVVLDFWATWCGPCKLTMPFLTTLQRTHAAAGLRVIGISIEDADDIRTFAAANKLDYTIARDPDGKVWQAYGAETIPMLVIIDKAGVVQHVSRGAGGYDEIEKTVARLLKE